VPKEVIYAVKRIGPAVPFTVISMMIVSDNFFKYKLSFHLAFRFFAGAPF